MLCAIHSSSYHLPRRRTEVAHMDPNRLMNLLQTETYDVFMLEMSKYTMQKTHQEPRSPSRATTMSGIAGTIEQMDPVNNLDVDDLSRAEFIPAVLGVVLDGYLCGFSRDELVCWSTDVAEYLEAVKVPSRLSLTPEFKSLAHCLRV